QIERFPIRVLSSYVIRLQVVRTNRAAVPLPLGQRQTDEALGGFESFPFVIAMVGAMLRGRPLVYWGHVLKLLRRADLEKIRAQFPFYPHADMLRAIQVSVDALETPARERYLALAVLLEDMAAAPPVQQTLWNVRQGQSPAFVYQVIGLRRKMDGHAACRL